MVDMRSRQRLLLLPSEWNFQFLSAFLFRLYSFQVTCSIVRASFPWQWGLVFAFLLFLASSHAGLWFAQVRMTQGKSLEIRDQSLPDVMHHLLFNWPRPKSSRRRTDMDRSKMIVWKIRTHSRGSYLFTGGILWDYGIRYGPGPTDYW